MNTYTTGMKKPYYTALLSLLLLLFSAAPAFAQFSITGSQRQMPYVDVSIKSDTTAVVPGDSFRIAIIQDIAPGWHTYWRNPGDSGTANTFLFTLPEGFVHSNIRWPAPIKINYQGLVNFGYEGRAVFILTVNPPDVIEQETVTLGADLTWLACKDICIPERGFFEITLPVNNTALPENQDLFLHSSQALPKKLDTTAEYYQESGNLIIRLSPAPPVPDNAYTGFFPTAWGMVDNAGLQTFKTTAEGLLISAPRAERDLNGIGPIEVVLRSNTGSYLFNAVPAEKMQAAPSFPQASDSFAYHLILALIGGLILNLMPCVFPVLSLKALSLAQMRGKERYYAILHGLSYTAGVLISFAGFALIILILRFSGTTLGWGFHLQNPYNILFLAYLLFGIGLSLAGLFTVSGRFVNWGNSLSHNNHPAGSFFTGILAALVATPCTAPFMATAIGYAAVQPAPQSILIFLTVGFGLALPYLLLSISPALQKMLPQPGIWMTRFKEFLAFPMFLTVIWLLWVLGKQAGMAAVFIALPGMVLLAFFLWLVVQSPQNMFKRLLLLCAMGGILLSFIFLPTAMQVESSENGFSTSAFEYALADDDAIFVNMTAAWCITCKINERTSLKNSSVQDIFDKEDILYMVGDWTNKNPEVTDFLSRFGRNGVPLYVFFPARINGIRPNPIILPQILTPNIIKDAVTR